jgi:hypothetical protein
MQSKTMQKTRSPQEGVLPEASARILESELETEKHKTKGIQVAQVTKAVLLDYRQDKLSWKEIGDSLGLTLSQIRRLRKKYKMNDNRVYYRNVYHGETLEDRARNIGYVSLRAMVMDYHFTGRSSIEVAERLKCHPHSVRMACPLNGVKVPPTDKQIQSRHDNAVKLNVYLTKTGRRHKMKG